MEKKVVCVTMSQADQLCFLAPVFLARRERDVNFLARPSDLAAPIVHRSSRYASMSLLPRKDVLAARKSLAVLSAVTEVR